MARGGELLLVREGGREGTWTHPGIYLHLSSKILVAVKDSRDTAAEETKEVQARWRQLS